MAFHILEHDTSHGSSCFPVCIFPHCMILLIPTNWVSPQRRPFAAPARPRSNQVGRSSAKTIADIDKASEERHRLVCPSGMAVTGPYPVTAQYRDCHCASMRQHASSTKMSCHVISMDWSKGNLTENQELSFMEKPIGFPPICPSQPISCLCSVGCPDETALHKYPRNSSVESQWRPSRSFEC